MANHFFFIEENQLKPISDLFDRKVNGEYIILNTNGVYSDIAQYVEKYQTVKIITVLNEKLDYNFQAPKKESTQFY